MDRFFSQKTCDRCGAELKVRQMSRFNTNVLCPKCIEAERQHPDYEKAAAVGLDESVVGATLRLRWVAPGLVHDILNGGCKDVSLKQLRHGVPELWREQVPGMVSSEVEA